MPRGPERDRGAVSVSMESERVFQGTVMKRGDAGPVVCSIALESGALRVVSSSATYLLNYATLQLSLGGASGHMVFCVAPLDGITVCVEHDAFISSTRLAANGVLDSACDALVAKKKTMHVWQWVTGGVLLAFVLLLALVPTLVMHAAGALPVSIDRKIGDVAVQAANFGGDEVHDPELNAALRTILARLTPHASTQGLDFRFHVIRNDEVNAFALPGGQIVVFTGLLTKAATPEQVAGVLAHEISHATLRHGVRSLARAAGIRYGFSLIFGDASGLLGYAEQGAVLAVIQSYSREQENDADAEGVRMLRAAGIDPRGLGDFFETIRHEDDNHFPGVVQWLNSHPDAEERIANVRRLAAGSPARSAPPLAIDWAAVQRAALGTTTSTVNKDASH